MDLSNFFERDEDRDLDTIFDFDRLKAIKVNRNPKYILLRVFIGRWTSGEMVPLRNAFANIIGKYKALDLEVIFEEYNNDKIFNEYKWTPADLFNCLREADIHLLPTLVHQNSLGRGTSHSAWTMREVTRGLLTLRNHLGSPCGAPVLCHTLTQDIALLYRYLFPLDLCAPFIAINIETTDLLPDQLAEIER